MNSLQYETNISIETSKEINNLKLKYLDVLNCIYESDQFFEVLENYPITNTEVKELTSLLFICEIISKKIITGDLNSKHYGIFVLKKIIQILSASSTFLINESQYTEMIETISVLIMMNDDFKDNEKILLETFLDNNHMTGRFCNDLWAVFLR